MLSDIACKFVVGFDFLLFLPAHYLPFWFFSWAVFFCSICSETAKTRYDEVAAAISAKEAQSERLVDFIRMLKKQDGSIAEFDERLWGCMVDFVTVSKKKEITVTFRNGSEIQA